MPSPYRLRRLFKPLVRQLARPFIALGISPNLISGLSFLVAILAAILLFLYGNFLLYGVFIFVAGVLDGVDGAVARATGQATARGGYLDSFLDRVADVVLLLPFLWVPFPLPLVGPAWVWVFMAITGCLLVSYIRSRALAAGASDTDVGLAARSERLFLLVLASLLSFFHPWAPFLGVVLLTILCHLTVLYRLLAYRRQL